jgi:putative flippase GtrA
MRLHANRTAAIQATKFCVVGGSGYVVNLLVYSMLLGTDRVDYVVAAVLAFIVAVANNYTWNRLWTFSSVGNAIASESLRFFVVAAAALGANILFLRTFVGLGLDAVPAQTGAVILATPVNFLGCKLWTFRAHPSTRRAADLPAPIGRLATSGRRIVGDVRQSLSTGPLLLLHWHRLRARVTENLELLWPRALIALAVRFGGFCFIAMNGIVLYTILFAAGTELLDFPYAIAGFLGTEAVTLWSYVFLETWVFHNRTYAYTRFSRIAFFFVVTHATIALSAPLLLSLSALGFEYLVANVLSVMVVTLCRFGLADAWVWRLASAAAEPAERLLLQGVRPQPTPATGLTDVVGA